VRAGQQAASAAFPPVAGQVRRTVTRLIETIQRLRPGIHVLVGDYWNVMKDGQVGLRCSLPTGTIPMPPGTR